MAFDFRVNFPHDDHLKINNFKGSTIIANLRGGPVLILVNFRGGPVLILELFSILVIFRVGSVKRNTLYYDINKGRGPEKKNPEKSVVFCPKN